MPITDNRTPHLDLPLPDRDNLLWDDVIRLIDALAAIDAKVKAIDELLASDDVDLDALQELVNAIKNNRTSIEDILTAKLNVAEFNRLAAPASAVAYDYDAQGRPQTVTETVNGKPRITEYAYNSDGLVSTSTMKYDGKTRVETYTYSAGRVAGVTVVES